MSASPSTPLRRRVPSKKYAAPASPDDSPRNNTTPLRNSNRANQLINDDKAERAARRKSAHFADVALAHSTGSSGKENANNSPNVADGPQRKASALTVQKERRAKRLSTVTPAPPVSMEVMNTNFEEWMKLATDNKITATNTWNFALIDYFHDLTLLRNGPDDQSINFQKASCTLDGCVKIWTSRVDSVATETGKLLSGLAGGGGGEEEEDLDGEEDESGEPKAARKSHRSEATLAKSFAPLQVKKFDLEFTVDPLFKKTSADFDEGGAMGLLMNHLGIDGTGRVVFDAGDAVVDEYEDEEEPEEELVDISKLREFIPSSEETASMTISETLGAFHFSTDANDLPDLAAITGLSSFNDEPENADVPMPTGEAHDFFGDEDYDMGPPGGFDDSGSMVGDEGDFGEAFEAGASAPGPSVVSYGPFDPRRAQGQGFALAFGGADDPDNMFQYFDSGFGKAWAGAEHWKLRKISHKDPAVVAATKEKKAAKAPFTIDFGSAEASQSTKTLFAPGSKTATQLPATSRKGKKSHRDEWLLPNDLHFSSRQLLRLFLKPKFALRMRRTVAQMAENANGEIDENFWAQAAADRAVGDEGMDMDDGGQLPFESQFFHDDGDVDVDDDAFVDDHLMPGVGDDADDLWQSTQGEELRRPRPENVRYAKKAKRVDVKRLKDDIWTDLRGLVDDDGSESDAAESTTPKEQAKTFDSVIHSLRTTYPREKMAEISTSFCFICLLHLANEEGLRIETARTDSADTLDSGMRGIYVPPSDDEENTFRQPHIRLDEGERTDRIVGELQALKVYKDPNAGRAA